MTSSPDPERAAEPPGEGDSDSQLIMVSGCPRSGTTLFTALLNTHPDVLIANEARLFSLLRSTPLIVAAGDGSFSRGAIGISLAAEMQTLLARRLRAVFLQEVSKYRLEICSRDELTLRLSRTIGRPRIWGDKNPLLSFRAARSTLATAKSVFPEVKWIFLVRHPASVMESMLRLGFTGHRQAAIAQWIECWEGLDFLRGLFGPDRVHVVRYEDLSGRRIAQTMSEAFTFLGISADQPGLERVADHLGAAIPHSSARSMEIDLGLELAQKVDMSWALSVPGFQDAARDAGYTVKI